MFKKGTAMFRALGGTKFGACGLNAPGAYGILPPKWPWPLPPTPWLHPKFTNSKHWLRLPSQPPRPCLMCPPLPSPPFPWLNLPDAAPAKGCCTVMVSCWIGGWYCRVGGGGTLAYGIAAIWFISAVWLVLSWLTAFAPESGMVSLMVLPIINAAMFAVVVAVLYVLFSLVKTLYILWGAGTHPCCPAVLQSCSARIHLIYTTAMKVLRAGYVLGVMASQSSNTFKGKMIACINKRTALLIICMSEYG